MKHLLVVKNSMAKKGRLPVVVSIVGVLIIWQLVTTLGNINKAFLPSPKDTFLQLGSSIFTIEFWKDLWSSWYRVILAFMLSFLVSYLVTLYALINKNFKSGLFIIVEFFRYLPIPVFIPLTILWFGIGDFSKIIIVFLGTFAQMIPMFYDSSLLLENKFNAFESSLKWDKKKYVRNIIIPGSMPYILDNSRICFGWAWTYLIIAELLGAQNGLGYAIIRAQRYLATDKIFAYIIVIGILGVVMDRFFQWIRLKYFKWA